MPSTATQQKVNKILNITNILIFVIGSLAFYGTLNKSIEGELFQQIKKMFYTGNPSSSLDWNFVTWSFSFLQSLFLTIRLIPTIWEVTEVYKPTKDKFWNHDAVIPFMLGMWLFIMIFFLTSVFPFAEVFFDKSKYPSAQITGGLSIYGINFAIFNVIFQFFGCLSFYLFFWTGNKFHPRKIYLIPGIFFVLYLIYMLPVFFS